MEKKEPAMKIGKFMSCAQAVAAEIIRQMKVGNFVSETRAIQIREGGLVPMLILTDLNYNLEVDVELSFENGAPGPNLLPGKANVFCWPPESKGEPVQELSFTYEYDPMKGVVVCEKTRKTLKA
jgi:hypothetical protein